MVWGSSSLLCKDHLQFFDSSINTEEYVLILEQHSHPLNHLFQEHPHRAGCPPSGEHVQRFPCVEASLGRTLNPTLLPDLFVLETNTDVPSKWNHDKNDRTTGFNEGTKIPFVYVQVSRKHKDSFKTSNT